VWSDIYFVISIFFYALKFKESKGFIIIHFYFIVVLVLFLFLNPRDKVPGV